MMKKLILVIYISGLFSNITSLRAEDGDGGQAGAFLNLGVGVKAIGMGGAFTALADDGSASHWNTAGLDYLGASTFYGMYSVLSFDRQHNFISLNHAFNNSGTIGLSWMHFGVGDIEGRDEFGELTENFSDNEMAIQLSYAKSIGSFVSLGVGVKYLKQTLADFGATGFGLDGGILVKIYRLVNIGSAVQNIGSSLKWDTDSGIKDTIPLTVRGGIALLPSNLPMKAAFDYVKVENQESQYHFGVEYWLLKSLGLRAGYAKEISYGASLLIPYQSGELQFDYALYQESSLNNDLIHRFGLSIRL